jgi:hypothetical protein
MLRNDLEHNYSSWIAFVRKKNHFVPCLTLAEGLQRNEAHKKFRPIIITLDEIVQIGREMDAFYRNAIKINIIDRLTNECSQEDARDKMPAKFSYPKGVR